METETALATAPVKADTSTPAPIVEAPWGEEQYVAALARLERLQDQLTALRSTLPSLVQSLSVPQQSPEAVFRTWKKDASIAVEALRTFRAEWEGRRTRTVMDKVKENEKEQADMSMAWEVGAYGWNEKAAALGGLDVTVKEIDEEDTEDTKADKKNGGVQDDFIKDLKDENRGANGAVMVTT
ncbi:hypothetical protein LTR16_001089 [Cryomyces antarcticus]|uniref:Mediator complex subunit 11 n=1 Tax=Cryomyces antarcticus TaxID=329879 RepID=A0ABR0M193_9PEZI|nr:hypothetical protein LTR39_000748 [Cryomyces antarcticus]KAK5019340.1 hypothetical protein LTR60_001154 [Cryomyces antarcticus]KAK5257284.1 hypothetical protein LTR16_001089 [Cryomyces antarcticus]